MTRWYLLAELRVVSDDDVQEGNHDGELQKSSASITSCLILSPTDPTEICIFLLSRAGSG